MDDGYFAMMGAYATHLGLRGPGAGERIGAVDVTTYEKFGACATCDESDNIVMVELVIVDAEPLFPYEGPFDPDFHRRLRTVPMDDYDLADFTRFVTERAKAGR